MTLFLDPEIIKMVGFLDPEIIKMVDRSFMAQSSAQSLHNHCTIIDQSLHKNMNNHTTKHYTIMKQQGAKTIVLDTIEINLVIMFYVLFQENFEAFCVSFFPEKLCT